MSALQGKPGKKKTKQQSAEVNTNSSALATEPVGGSADRIQKRINFLKSSRPGDPEIKKLQRKLEGLNAAPPPAADTGMADAGQGAGDGFDQVNDQSNQLMNQYMQQMQQQGQFNPNGLPSLNQDYSQMRQQAEQRVMESFERQMGPVFQQQQAAFDQQMADRGIPMGSELYEREKKNLLDAQQGQRQNAMSQAFQMGASEQAQAFGQASQANNQMFGQQLTQYQLPASQLGVLAPFYGGQNQANMQQGQQQFIGGQNAMDREFQKELAALQAKYQMNQLKFQAAHPGPTGGGGGGGALSYDQRLGLLDREFYNNLALQGMQLGQGLPPQPNQVVNGIAQGVAQGGTAAVIGGLT